MKYYRNIIAICLFGTMVMSCGQTSGNGGNAFTATTDTTAVEPINNVDANKDNTILFLGHEIQTSPKEILHEFKRISDIDDNLSLDSVKGNVTIYGTTFHINTNENMSGFILMTSVQPNALQMKKVIAAINKYHGEEYPEDGYHYAWLPFTDSTKIGQNYPIIHLRRIHSEEGGTIIIVQ